MDVRLRFQEARQFVTTDIWRIHLKDLSGSKLFLIKLLRVGVLAFKGFTEDQVQLRASALTFFSLLSIVPVVAMAFGIAKGFGLETLFHDRVIETFAGQEQVIEQIFRFSDTLLQNTKGGVVAGIGLVILIWTVINLLRNIEESFNWIWGVKSARTYIRKFTDYLTIMVIAPMLVILSSSLTIYISTYIISLTKEVQLLDYISSYIFFLLRLTPYTIIWLVLTLIYIIMPNTRVRLTSAFIAGIFAGTLYQLTQILYINFQVGVARYNAIYGSFAALPLFMVYLQISWLIILLGAELSWAYQNVEKYEFEKDSKSMSPAFHRVLSLMVMQLLVKNFAKGALPLTTIDISESLKIPIRLVDRILVDLTDIRLATETALEGYKDIAYQPGEDTDRLTVLYVWNKLERSGFDDLPMEDSDEYKTIVRTLQGFGDAMERLPENKRLKDIS